MENYLPVSLAGISPRDYQIEAWQRLRSMRLSGDTRGLIHMATGLGKTTVAAGDIAQFIEEQVRSGAPQPRILFLAHQRELLRQAHTQLQSLLPHLNYSAFEGGKQASWKAAKVSFATLQAMANRLKNTSPQRFDYIVVDESHHGAAPQYNHVISHFQPKFLLGLTATPFRRDQADLTQLFGPIVYSMPLAKAIASGWLMSPDYRLYRDEVLNDLIERDFSSVNALNRALFAPERNEQIAQFITQTQTSMQVAPRTIIFTRNIEHAEIFGEYLPHAKVLHSGMKRDRQRDIIAGFRSGRFPTVITVDMFNEGVDIPEANLIVFLRSTSSRTIFEQQLGRGLRKTKSKNSVIVMDFVGTSERLYDLYHLRRKVQEAGRQLVTSGNDPVDIQQFPVHFTRQDLAIISRLKELQTVLPTPPPNYRNLTELSNDVGHSPQTIKETCKALNIPLTLMRRRQGREGYYFSPDQIRQIKRHLPQPENKPDEVQTLREFATASGLGVALIRSAMKQLGIQGTLQRTAGVRGGATALNKDERQQIVESIELAPKSAVNVSALATELRLTYTYLRKQLHTLSITPQAAYSVTTHVPGMFITGEEAKRVRQAQNASESATTTSQIATELGISLSVVERAIRNSNVVGTKARPSDGGRSQRTFTKKERQTIIKAVGVAPDGWVSVREIAANLELSESSLRYRMSQSNVVPERFLTPGLNIREQYLAPEQVQILER